MDRIFEWYRRHLMRLHEQHGQLRMIVIEYMCGAPKIDPVVMARSLVDSGCRVVFDDSSISFKENEQEGLRITSGRVPIYCSNKELKRNT